MSTTQPAESTPQRTMEPRDEVSVLVIGGGNAGLSVAGRLLADGATDVAIIEPRDEHHYKPLFSYVAGGTARASEARRSQRSLTPRGARWVRDSVVAVDPERRTVDLASGSTIAYEHLVVCPGIQYDWDAVPGLAAAIETPEVASNYTLELAVKASPLLRDTTRGTVVFSQPAGPGSCVGAIQKPMYQACDYWRARGVLDAIRVVLVVPDATVFGISQVDEELDRKIREYGIELLTESEITEVRSSERVVDISSRDGERSQELAYDALIVEPPQSGPDWIAKTGLTADGLDGFVEVDAHTLRHPRFPNVWSLGDAAATRNSKSGGAIREQSRVVADNIRAVQRGGSPTARTTGYGVCPFTVSRSTVVFAEFDDQHRLTPTFPLPGGLMRERRLTWLIDRHLLPRIYWKLITQGRA